jgi:NAD+ kinase
MKIGLFESTRRPEALKWAKQAAIILNELNCNVLMDPSFESRISEPDYNFIIPTRYEDFRTEADAVVSFGGDGTMLSAARMLEGSQVAIMGINVGRLGFLAEYNVNKLYTSMNDLVNGTYRTVDRTIIETYVSDSRLFALNDIVIEKKDTGKLIEVEAYSDGHFIGNYRADGLIISTPTGSTAYSLSCGGPIIAPSTPVLCITPISPHTLTLRPLVLPDTNEIRLRVNSPSGLASVIADGQIETQLKDGESIVIKKSINTVKLIKPLESTYYDLLRTKLLWSVNGTEVE